RDELGGRSPSRPWPLERWLPPALLLAGLALWEVAARAGWISALFFPPPSAITLTLLRMVGGADFWAGLGSTLMRLTAGVLIGGGAGLLLGWLMGVSRPLRVALAPLVAALHPLPKLALFPIVLVILGIGESSKVALVALTAFFPMLLNTLAGVQQIDPTHWEVAANYGATGGKLLRRVVLPGSLPMTLTGLRLAVNGALVVTIAIEMLSARQGLGATIWLAWQTLRTEDLYATLVVIGGLGLASNQLLESATRLLLPWKGKP
ncbi:MAG: ABC transporter permease, partial [Caldilinea sp.]|nr:ABC transporter permease [Caldilinea sp.]